LILNKIEATSIRVENSDVTILESSFDYLNEKPRISTLAHRMKNSTTKKGNKKVNRVLA